VAALSKALHEDGSDRVRGEAATSLLALGATDEGSDYKTASHPEQDTPQGTVGPQTSDPVEL